MQIQELSCLCGRDSLYPGGQLRSFYISGLHFDTELSVNIFGTAGLRHSTPSTHQGDLKPYRAWIRFSSDQLELRIGLQKLNFGSASILRPLMWFDQMDPRDPLQLTDGLWAFLQDIISSIMPISGYGACMEIQKEEDGMQYHPTVRSRSWEEDTVTCPEG